MKQSMNVCAICGEADMDKTRTDGQLVEVICDTCELECIADVEASGLDTADIDGDLAITREMV